jgi:phage FluMu protein Com
MIQISLTTALVLYSSVLLILLLLIWIYTEVSVRRSYRVLEKQFLWRCVFCSYIYLDEAAETLSQCPRCHSFSSVDDKHARYVTTHASAASQDRGGTDGADTPRRNPSHRKRPQQRRRGPRRR